VTKGALDLQPQVIKFTSCLPMDGGSLRVLRLLPPLKRVTMILLKVALNTIPKLFKKKDYSRKLIFYYEKVIQKQTY
jgi:hypothetical protein